MVIQVGLVHLALAVTPALLDLVDGLVGVERVALAVFLDLLENPDSVAGLVSMGFPVTVVFQGSADLVDPVGTLVQAVSRVGLVIVGLMEIRGIAVTLAGLVKVV